MSPVGSTTASEPRFGDDWSSASRTDSPAPLNTESWLSTLHRTRTPRSIATSSCSSAAVRLTEFIAPVDVFENVADVDDSEVQLPSHAGLLAVIALGSSRTQRETEMLQLLV